MNSKISFYLFSLRLKMTSAVDFSAFITRWVQKVAVLVLLFSFSFSAEIALSNFSELYFDGEGWAGKKSFLESAVDQDPSASSADYYLSLDGKLPAGSKGLVLWTEGYLGKALTFRSPQNAVSVPHSPALFFNTSPDLGDFYIEFFFRLNETADGQILLEKKGTIYDRVNENLVTQSISFGVEGTKLKADFINFFHYKNKHYSFSLSHGKNLTVGHWYQAAIVFHRSDAELIKILDGQVEERLYTTLSGEEQGMRLYPSFMSGTASDLVLGKNFSGELDEIRMSRGERERFVVKKYPDSTSSFVSSVLPLSAYSKIKKITFDKSLGGSSSVDVMLRVSPNYFLPDEDSLPWQKVPVEQDFESPEGQYLQFQFKLHNQGLTKPNVLNAVRFEVDTDPAPTSPDLISVEPADGAVFLKWRISSEEDLAGYKVYLLKGSGELRKNAKEVEKRVFAFQKSWRKENAEDSIVEMKVDGLENGVVYSFALSSYDLKSETHESPLSKIVSVTPSRF